MLLLIQPNGSTLWKAQKSASASAIIKPQTNLGAQSRCSSSIVRFVGLPRVYSLIPFPFGMSRWCQSRWVMFAVHHYYLEKSNTAVFGTSGWISSPKIGNLNHPHLSYPRFILVGRLGIQSKVRYDLKLSRVEETTSCARRQTISFQSDWSQ